MLYTILDIIFALIIGIIDSSVGIIFLKKQPKEH